MNAVVENPVAKVHDEWERSSRHIPNLRKNPFGSSRPTYRKSGMPRPAQSAFHYAQPGDSTMRVFIHVYLAFMRVLALTLVIFGVLIPQLVCFLPSDQMTQAESECCKHMAGDCGESNMQGHACCAGIVRPDAALTLQAYRQFVPHFELAAIPLFSEAADFRGRLSGAAILAQRDIHAPPNDDPFSSSLILRI
jgi:hypothetical protein